MKKVILESSDVYSFPGISAPGSNGDRAILEAKEKINKKYAQRPFSLKISSELVRSGVVNGDLMSLWEKPVNSFFLGNKAIEQIFDSHTLVQMDNRVRWCRCLLTRLDLPFDREPIRMNEDHDVWAYESEIETSEEDELPKTEDPLDWILFAGERFSSYWYAAKVLAHFRRVDALWNDLQKKSDEFSVLGIVRESTLFGETWAEAMHVINYGSHTLRGIKQLRHNSSGGKKSALAKEPMTAEILDEMRKLRLYGMSVSSAAYAVARKGYGSSQSANRRLWYRQQNKVVTAHSEVTK